MADASMHQSFKATGGRGANSNTDYKVHYLKCKDKFDRVTTEQAEFRSNISRASLKQQKLRDEIHFLLDAIAAKQAKRAAAAAAASASYAPAMSISPARRDPSLLYSSSTSHVHLRKQRRSVEPSRGYERDYTPSRYPAPHRSDAVAAHRTLSPPPSSIGAGYKRPRTPSDDPEAAARSGLEAERGPNESYRDAHGARPAYREDEIGDTPALKRPRNH